MLIHTRTHTHTNTQANTIAPYYMHKYTSCSQAMTLFGFCCSSPLLFLICALVPVAVAVLFLDLFFVNFLNVSFFHLFPLLLCFFGLSWVVGVVAFCLIRYCILTCVYCYYLCFLFRCCCFCCFLLYFSQLLVDLKCMHVCLYMCLYVYGLLYLPSFSLSQFKCIYGRKYILDVLLLHNKRVYRRN